MLPSSSYHHCLNQIGLTLIKSLAFSFHFATIFPPLFFSLRAFSSHWFLINWFLLLPPLIWAKLLSRVKLLSEWSQMYREYMEKLCGSKLKRSGRNVLNYPCVKRRPIASLLLITAIFFSRQCQSPLLKYITVFLFRKEHPCKLLWVWKVILVLLCDQRQESKPKVIPSFFFLFLEY